MLKANKLFEFECGRIVELQRAIAAEVHLSKTMIYNFLKDPESYGTAKSSGKTKKKFPCIE